ncbi:MAG: dihydrolipoamide acetyltransferase family protein [Dehalobacterium sp.]
MAVEIIMPQMGLTMTEGTVIRWLKREGDFIAKGEAILEIESDKAAFEVESPSEGTLLKILISEGEVVPVAGIIGYIGDASEEIFPPSPSTEVKKMNVREVMGEKNVEDIRIEPVKRLNQGRVFISPRARKALGEKGLLLDDVLGIAGSGPNGRIIEKDILLYAQKQAVKATPLAKKMADEYGMNLESIKGSDFEGKITSQDVLHAVRPAEKSATGFIERETSIPVNAAGMEEEILEIIPFKGIRKIIAERMHYSSTTIPRVTHTTEVDMTEMASLRKKLNSNLKDEDKISFINIIVKIGAMALEKHPKANARLEEDGIKLLTNSHIGIAVDTEAGLVVPNIKFANKKSLRKISQEAKDLIYRGKMGRLLPDEMTGGTFTISNLGGPKHAIDGFTPIINWPEATILGLGRVIDKPWVVNEKIVIRKMMVLSLTFDHRIIDGGPAAEFLHTIKELLENPLEIILGI